mmetsp:Transcript_3673/g.6831  ORF Transcript_3673/g.6831 Transcript_3673/m.6831 type:complete len:514 (+) Transcript_3673:269-1810(+)
MSDMESPNHSCSPPHGCINEDNKPPFSASAERAGRHRSSASLGREIELKGNSTRCKSSECENSAVHLRNKIDSDEKGAFILTHGSVKIRTKVALGRDEHISAETRRKLGNDTKARWTEMLLSSILVSILIAGTAYDSFQTNLKVSVDTDLEKVYVSLVLSAILIQLLATFFALMLIDTFHMASSDHMGVFMLHFKSLLLFPRKLILFGGALFAAGMLIQGHIQYEGFLKHAVPSALAIGVPAALGIHLSLMYHYNVFKELLSSYSVGNVIGVSMHDLKEDLKLVMDRNVRVKKALLRKLLATQDLTALLIIFTFGAFTKQMEVQQNQLGYYNEPEPAMLHTFTALTTTSMTILALALQLSYNLWDKINAVTSEALPALLFCIKWELRAPPVFVLLSILLVLAIIMVQAIMDYSHESRYAILVIYGLALIVVTIMAIITQGINKEFEAEIAKCHNTKTTALAAVRASRNMNPKLRKAWLGQFHSGKDVDELIREGMQQREDALYKLSEADLKHK